ncbi:MAG: RDD family protein [Armatimonadetes bacterium]|nr:RDD family protein [Armatimonadota bacterium]
MAREITIMTPEQVEVKFELAGIGSRAIAMIVDTLWQTLVFIALYFLLFIVGVSSIVGSSSPPMWLFAVFAIIVFVITSGYFLYFEATKNGQTPGKKAAGIRVVRDTGHPIDFRSALLRNVMRIVDFLPGSYGVAIISVFLSNEYRRLGDYVAGTLVVKVGAKPDVLENRSAVNAPAAYPNAIGVSQVSETPSLLPAESMPYISSIKKDEYRAIRHFLDRRIELEAQIALNLASKLAEPIAQKLKIEIVSIDDPVAFLEAVGKEWERRVIH